MKKLIITVLLVCGFLAADICAQSSSNAKLAELKPAMVLKPDEAIPEVRFLDWVVFTNDAGTYTGIKPIAVRGKNDAYDKMEIIIIDGDETFSGIITTYYQDSYILAESSGDSYKIDATDYDDVKQAIRYIEKIVVNNKYTGLLKPAMVLINGGTFTMGSPSNEAERIDDEVQHQVTVSSFYMGKYEVTQGEYESVMGNNPSKFKGANLPVENISWYEAVEYCNKRSEKDGLTPAYTIDKNRKDPSNTSTRDDLKWIVIRDRSANGYRLPTEAEWEYACRAGTVTPYSSGSTAAAVGWYKDNSGDRTRPVGEKQPNAFGLYDMHGNVWEWCWDWYGSYASGTQKDPTGASSGANRVDRGGSWYFSAQYLRSANRSDNSPVYRDYYNGFRLARSDR